MRRAFAATCSTLAAAAALAALPVAPAVAQSIQPSYLPAGRLEISGKHGYAEVVYDKKIKKISYIEIYYACRAAGPAKSKYPAYIALESENHVSVQGGRASGSFTEKITEEFDPKAIGAEASVTWKLSEMRISTGGLSGKLSFDVKGPATVCPFSLGTRPFVPDGRPGDKNY
jgi:hypothetical protein